MSSSTNETVRGGTQNETDGVRAVETRFTRNVNDWPIRTNTALSNWNAHLYSELFQAIDQMTKLSSTEPLALDEKVAHKALNVLGFIREQMKIEPPRIINQDGDALSFTWIYGSLKRYLTIADDEVDLMHLSLNHPFRCEEVLSNEDEIPYREILLRLSALPNSRTTEDDL
jgi:hypothetical protein